MPFVRLQKNALKFLELDQSEQADRPAFAVRFVIGKRHRSGTGVSEQAH